MKNFKKEIIPLASDEQNKLTGGFYVVNQNDGPTTEPLYKNLNCNQKGVHVVAENANCVDCKCGSLQPINSSCDLQFNKCSGVNGFKCLPK